MPQPLPGQGFHFLLLAGGPQAMAPWAVSCSLCRQQPRPCPWVGKCLVVQLSVGHGQPQNHRRDKAEGGYSKGLA